MLTGGRSKNRLPFGRRAGTVILEQIKINASKIPCAVTHSQDAANGQSTCLTRHPARDRTGTFASRASVTNRAERVAENGLRAIDFKTAILRLAIGRDTSIASALFRQKGKGDPLPRLARRRREPVKPGILGQPKRVRHIPRGGAPIVAWRRPCLEAHGKFGRRIRGDRQAVKAGKCGRGKGDGGKEGERSLREFRSGCASSRI